MRRQPSFPFLDGNDGRARYTEFLCGVLLRQRSRTPRILQTGTKFFEVDIFKQPIIHVTPRKLIQGLMIVVASAEEQKRNSTPSRVVHRGEATDRESESLRGPPRCGAVRE